MPDFDFKDSSQAGGGNDAGQMSEEILAEQDLLMEEIINNLNNTPVGQVLKKLACAARGTSAEGAECSAAANQRQL